MPRRARGPAGDTPYHVLNRAVRRSCLFRSDGDYAAFEEVLCEALQRVPIRLVAYCVMPNHWHLIVWPNDGGQIPRFMQWLTGTHAQRWQAFRGLVGTGPVYQGRFKGVPIRSDRHVLWACRYVERNPVRACLVTRAEDWRWSSLWRRCHRAEPPLLSDWPVRRPSDWVAYVNRPASPAELDALGHYAFPPRPRGRPAGV